MDVREMGRGSVGGGVGRGGLWDVKWHTSRGYCLNSVKKKNTHTQKKKNDSNIS